MTDKAGEADETGDPDSLTHFVDAARARIEAALEAWQSLVEQAPGTEFALDLERSVLAADGREHPVFLPEAVRLQFIEGRWDATNNLLAARERILKTAASLPYIDHWR